MQPYHSPFRRAETPASPSPLRYFTVTPNGSPSKAEHDTEQKQARDTSHTTTPRAARPTTPPGPHEVTTTATATTTATNTTNTTNVTNVTSTTTTNTTTTTPEKDKENPESKMVTSPRRPSSSGWGTSSKSLGGGSALSQLQPAQVRTLRDGFQILDRDCDGVVTKEDVADMLTQLGLPSGPTDVGLFFPPSKPQTLTLAAFLNSLAETLAVLSPSSELMSAFSTFDDDDSGQVDWAELKEALLSTPPEAGQRALSAAEVDKVVAGFTGRRAFNRNMNAHMAARRGEVFRYQEFVNSIMGASGGPEGGSHQGSEDQ
ncbi:Myosin regulatory light chain 1 [Escovopsis weberi]|uniref:Myosin regulatory light chain 1 n=1 Tax=Escovopsis weberi TaxID=150374 RepID=A0A0M8MU37_ESCWE|nr:Myosin regulatory light chain 1 [Escovopsis weberi]